MTNTPASESGTSSAFDSTNWVSSDPLPRDREQSHRLHEPAHLMNTIDPITGRDIPATMHHPHIEDGNVTMYFESEETRQAYLDTPIDHPFGRLPGPPGEEDDRGG